MGVIAALSEKPHLIQARFPRRHGRHAVLFLLSPMTGASSRDKLAAKHSGRQQWEDVKAYRILQVYLSVAAKFM
jgi:hypothetical protein